MEKEHSSDQDKIHVNLLGEKYGLWWYFDLLQLSLKQTSV